MNAADEILAPRLTQGRDSTVAILFGGEAITYSELDVRVNRLGNGLLARGVGVGERVLLVMKDTPDMVAAYLAAIRIGAVAVALSTRATAKDIAFAVTDSGARALFIDEDFLPLWREARAGASPLVFVRGAGGEGESTEALAAGQSAELHSRDMAPDDIALWLYTSGTTGTPKGAMHRHGSVLIGDMHLRENFGVEPGDRLFSSSKLFFAFALGHILIGGLRCGATLILYDGWPDSDAVAGVVERYRPDVMFSVPTFYRNLLRDGHAGSEAFRRIRHFVSAGEKLPEVLFERWREATGTPILEGIGTTETLFLMIASTPPAHRPGATGRPLPWVETRLLDETGAAVTAPEQPGILSVRMASVAAGYWNQPGKTAAAFQDNWFRTGDMFSVDAEGWWTHHGRGDYMLKISGQWVSPGEVEECALAVPGVADAAAVGIPNADGLVRMVLFLVGPERPGERARVEEAVRAKLLSSLSVYKCPRVIRFLDDMPRTATGKVQRFALRDLAGVVG